MATIFCKLSNTAVRSARSYVSLSNHTHLLTSTSRGLASSFRSRVHLPFNGALAKRSYYVDRYNVEHFRKRGPRRWFEDRKIALIVVITGGVLGVEIFLKNIETVPYTNRRRLMLFSMDFEIKLGERSFDLLRDSFKRSVLPSFDPDSIRVKLISQRIIDSLNRGLGNERVWNDLRYASPSPNSAHGDQSLETVRVLTDEKHGHESFPEDEGWEKKKELLDENWAKTSGQKGRKRGDKGSISHLESFKWEVVVVHSPEINAFCIGGGKIVVFTGLFKHFKSDEEIATIISHEVAHAVARHSAEKLTKSLFHVILGLILQQFVIPTVADTMSNLLFELPFSRMMELEADYIGILLMASAGYDPRAAPAVYEKLGKISGNSALADYLYTHPSGKKRAHLLEKAHVMEEAISLYREAIAGNLIEGFL